MKKITAVCLAFCMICACFSAYAANDSGINTKTLFRVGLKYSSTAAAGVNVYADYGYRLGYFDADDTFHEVYTFGAEDSFLSFAKDANVNISGYTVSDSGTTTIGAYSVQINTPYSTASDAKTALKSVQANVPDSFVAYEKGTYYIRMGSFSGWQEAEDARVGAYAGYYSADQLETYGLVGRRITVINMDTQKIVFEFRSDESWPAIYPIQKDGAERMLLKNGSIYYYGAFEFNRLSSSVALISVVNPQEYLYGVLPFEMSNSWPVEALKAQAMAAKSYALYNMGKHSSYGFDICNTTDCQVYKTTSLMESDNVRRAVDETNGYLLTYDGSPIQGLYSSTTYGRTLSAKYWYGNDIPYLQSADDSLAAYTYPWEETFTTEWLTSRAASRGYQIGNVTNVYVSQYVDGLYAYQVALVGDKGTYTLKNTSSVVSFFGGLRSASFTINAAAPSDTKTFSVITGKGTVSEPLEEFYVIDGRGERQKLSGSGGVAVITGSGTETLTAGTASSGSQTAPSDGTFVLAGSGYGHGVGMSQWGAYGMAKKGSTYQEILANYYPGTTLTYDHTLYN